MQENAMARSKQNLSKTKPKRLGLGPGVMFGDVIYDPGGTYGPRVQPEVQLVLLHSGEVNISVDGAWSMVSAQTVCVLLPGHLEYFVFAKHTRTHHGWVSLSPHLLPETLLKKLRDGPRNVPLSNQLHHLIQLGLSVSNNDIEPNLSSLHDVLIHLAQTAIRQFVLDAETLGRKKIQPRALQVAQQFIDTQFAEPIQILDVARHANISPQHLGKLFKTHLQITPAHYLWQTRTKRGAEMLQATGLSVSEIAERCGFQNPFHFSRMIRNHYGLSPRTFRARAWGGE
jgi:AraC-like DNA-binding protein